MPPMTVLEKLAVSFLLVACVAGYSVLGISWYATAHGEPFRGSFQAGCRLLGLM